MEYRNRNIAALFLAAIAVIVCLALNLNEFIFGNAANIKNVAVTLTYIVLWLGVIMIGMTGKSRRVLKGSLVFWLLTFVFSAITAYVDMTSAQVDWAIPFVLLFMPQWYGLIYFSHNYLVISVVVAVIAAGTAALLFAALRSINKAEE